MANVNSKFERKCRKKKTDNEITCAGLPDKSIIEVTKKKQTKFAKGVKISEASCYKKTMNKAKSKNQQEVDQRISGKPAKKCKTPQKVTGSYKQKEKSGNTERTKGKYLISKESGEKTEIGIETQKNYWPDHISFLTSDNVFQQKCSESIDQPWVFPKKFKRKLDFDSSPAPSPRFSKSNLSEDFEQCFETPDKIRKAIDNDIARHPASGPHFLLPKNLNYVKQSSRTPQKSRPSNNYHVFPSGSSAHALFTENPSKSGKMSSDSISNCSNFASTPISCKPGSKFKKLTVSSATCSNPLYNTLNNNKDVSLRFKALKMNEEKINYQTDEKFPASERKDQFRNDGKTTVIDGNPELGIPPIMSKSAQYDPYHYEQESFVDTEYLDGTVLPIISMALKDLVKERPPDPISFLGRYLKKYREVNSEVPQMNQIMEKHSLDYYFILLNLCSEFMLKPYS